MLFWLDSICLDILQQTQKNVFLDLVFEVKGGESSNNHNLRFDYFVLTKNSSPNQPVQYKWLWAVNNKRKYQAPAPGNQPGWIDDDDDLNQFFGFTSIMKMNQTNKIISSSKDELEDSNIKYDQCKNGVHQ